MADKAQLIRDLAGLPDWDWFDVLREVKARREEEYDRNGDDTPQPGVTAEAYADWIARGHISVDAGIQEVLYLPTGAPSDVIRLLEIDALGVAPENEPIFLCDMTPSIDGINYQVHVVDITPDQWESVKRDPKLLPPGWSLDGARVLVKRA